MDPHFINFFICKKKHLACANQTIRGLYKTNYLDIQQIVGWYVDKNSLFLQQLKKKLLKKNILTVLPNAVIYLFGSRVDNNKKGGDVDIMVLADRELGWKEKS